MSFHYSGSGALKTDYTRSDLIAVSTIVIIVELVFEALLVNCKME